MSDASKTMKAFIARRYGGPEVIEEAQVPLPTATGQDLLIRVHAVATNPVDLRLLENWGNTEAKVEAEHGVRVGFDGAGVVTAVGPEVTGFHVGDEVYYAGLFTRAGTFAEYVLVDERIVAHKPKSLSWVEAASVPLVGLTAWEGLTESLGVPVPAKDAPESKNPDAVLIIGAAGGVGSLAIQLAKHVLKLKVIATASRPESIDWCKSLGADLVVDHSKPLLAQLKAHGLDGVRYVFNAVDTIQYFDQCVEVALPLGAILSITGTNGKPLDIGKLMFKRVAYHFGLMFTRPLFNAQPEEQRKSLEGLREYLDNKVIKHVLTKQFDLNTQGLQDALAYQASGKAIGKIGLRLL